MGRPPLVAPVPRSTPARPTSSPLSRRPLPADLLKDASRRLGVLALVGAGLWTIATVLWHLVDSELRFGVDGSALGVPDIIAAVAVGASILLSVYTRQRDRDPRRILDLGLAYMVLTGVALGLVFHWTPMPHGRMLAPEISWVGAVVLMFAAIVPSTPAKTAMAGLLAVTMNPVSMLIARARGTWTFPHASDAFLMHYPDFLLVGVAVVISHVVTSLGQQVAKAREMGSYQLGEMLGRGGMGEVYKATHRLLARPAAIKLIRPEMVGGRDAASAHGAVTRFRREAEAAANLRSPHTVELYDFGVTDDGTLYFVMELLEGLDLESLVRLHGPLPSGRTAHILGQLCASLAEAHASGLVHRDIKPANIHVGRLGLIDDFVKVLDFGLVKPVAEERQEDSAATQAGLLLGTPGYMAPEMARGEPVDARSDLYAVGCVGYYLMTGHQVFEGATAVQVMAQHLQTAPVPPSERVSFPVSPGLERVVLACLAKDPRDRPQSALDLARQVAAAGTDPWTEADACAWWSAVQPAAVPAAIATDTGAMTREVS